MIKTKFLCQVLHFLFTPCSANHSAPFFLGQLTHNAPYCTRCSIHEHNITLPSLRQPQVGQSTPWCWKTNEQKLRMWHNFKFRFTEVNNAQGLLPGKMTSSFKREVDHHYISRYTLLRSGQTITTDSMSHNDLGPHCREYRQYRHYVYVQITLANRNAVWIIFCTEKKHQYIHTDSSYSNSPVPFSPASFFLSFP